MKSLVEEGMEVVFGVHGTQLYGIVTALRDEPAVRMITTRHEQATTYMADGYARTTGKPGVALVVPGVGLYNAAAGIATAYARCSPVLVIAGQIPRDQIGKNRGAVHEIEDQASVVRPITKWRRSVLTVGEIPAAVNEAFRQMRTVCPRPVLIEIPPDVGVEREEVTLRSTCSRVAAGAQPGTTSGSVLGDSAVPPSPHLCGRRSGAFQCRRSPGQVGRSNQHPGHHIRRREGNHTGHPPPVIRFMCQPERREARDEPTL